MAAGTEVRVRRKEASEVSFPKLCILYYTQIQCNFSNLLNTLNSLEPRLVNCFNESNMPHFHMPDLRAKDWSKILYSALIFITSTIPVLSTLLQVPLKIVLKIPPSEGFHRLHLLCILLALLIQYTPVYFTNNYKHVLIPSLKNRWV